MKIQQLLQEDAARIDEISIKQGLAAGLLAGAFGLHNAPSQQTAPPYVAPYANVQAATQQGVETPEINPKYKATVDQIVNIYKVDPQLANEVVELSHKYADPVFPTAQDLIHLIGVESSFNPQAESGLKTDKAYGLTQIRPAANGLTRADLATPDDQIRIGSQILKKLYTNLKGNKKATLQAYNIGLKNYKRGKTAPRYVKKFDKELQRYAYNDIKKPTNSKTL